MQTIVLTALALTLLSGPATPKEKPTLTPAPSHATGTFEVKVTPDPAGADYGRMNLDKQFAGDLDGSSKGQMLSAMGNVKGSGAYVAIERVTGTLAGRKGTFVLFHRGVMQAGSQEMLIEVVPDSGTDELQGIRGTMKITITEGKHFYDFAYALP